MPSVNGSPRLRRLRRWLTVGLSAAGLGVAASLVTGCAQVIGDPLGIVSLGTMPSDSPSAWIAVSNGGTATSTPLPAPGPVCSVEPYNGASLCLEGLSASTTGSASGSPWGSGISGTGCASGVLAVSVLGCSNGSLIGISGTGCASGWIAIGGTCASSPYGSAAAVAGTGCASSQGEAAISVLGCANQGQMSGVALSGTGSANSGPDSATQVAVSGTGSATGYEAVSGMGPANGYEVAASGTGSANANGWYPVVDDVAVSGLGAANACGGRDPIAFSAGALIPYPGANATNNC